MRTLLTEGFRRLEGKSTQGVFKLTQAMGGRKTHNLLALGLLARHPEFRAEVMGEFYTPDADLGPVRVVAFSGRESDAPFGIWGAIAEQLGRKEQFNDNYAPLSAPGQTAWVKLLQGDPLVIMLDELPPYFVNAAATRDTADSMTWLRTELRDYWPRREPLVAVLRYLAALTIPHWRTDADAARLVSGAVENDHV